MFVACLHIVSFFDHLLFHKNIVDTSSLEPQLHPLTNFTFPQINSLTSKSLCLFIMSILFQLFFACFYPLKYIFEDQPTMNEQEKCVLWVFGLVQFQSFMNNNFITNITLIQCNNIMMIITKLKDIVFYQITFWFLAPS